MIIFLRRRRGILGKANISRDTLSYRISNSSAILINPSNDIAHHHRYINIMSQHARIEEVSDSDLDSDPSEQDPSDFADSLIRPASIPTSPPLRAPPIPQPQYRAPSALENDRHKRYQCLYPLYFDASRTRAQGRRVGHELAVPNPLAREIVEAVQLLGLDTVFEPGKVHPKDWSNPGRVRVLIKEGGRMRNRGVKNSMCLHGV